MNADRLFQAAEAVMAALATGKGGMADLSRLIGSTREPKCLWGFSSDEVMGATRFLARLGYVTVTPRP
jgi:hypothetical protein